jgi:hypothetical protein
MLEENKNIQQTAISGRDSKQTAGDNKETNGNLFIGIFFFLVIAFGGLVWALNIGLNQGGQTPKIESKSQTP